MSFAGDSQGGIPRRAAAAVAFADSQDLWSTNLAVQQRKHSELRGAQGSCSERSVDSSLIGVQLVVTSAAASRVTDVQNVILNELLTYINVYSHDSTVEALLKVVLMHISHEEIAEAMRLLAHELQAADGLAQFTTERRNSSARPAHEAEVEDFIGILNTADSMQALDGFLFVACNFPAMPKCGPKEINLAVVVERQVQMDATISYLSTSVAKTISNPTRADSFSLAQQAAQSVAQDMKQQLGAFNDGVNRRLDHLSAVCVQHAEKAAVTPPSRVSVSLTPRASTQSRDAAFDRSMNLMLFGVSEDKDAAVCRRKVDQVLQFVSGNSVDVLDMFRVGRFAQNKLWPIIIELRTIWDNRIILSKCSKLKEFGEPTFIAADEPLEIRRKNMLMRTQTRAERAGKSVSVADGVLSIDNVKVFSLRYGKLPIDD